MMISKSTFAHWLSVMNRPDGAEEATETRNAWHVISKDFSTGTPKNLLASLKNTPIGAILIPLVRETPSSLHHYLLFTVPPSVPPSAPLSVTKTSTVSRSPPSFLQSSQNPVSTLTTSSEAHWFIGTSTKEVINIVLSPPANRGIPKTVWIRSLERPPSLTNDQDLPLGLPKLYAGYHLGNADLQPNHKALPPEVTTGPPPGPDGNSFVTPALSRGNQPSPDHTATRGITSGESASLRPVHDSSFTPASTQGSVSVVQTVTSGLPTVQSSARRAFQPAQSPHRHTTTKWAPSPTLTTITEPSVTTVTGGKTSDGGLTVAAERILQSRSQPEVTTGPPPISPAEGNSVAPTPLPQLHHCRYYYS